IYSGTCVDGAAQCGAALGQGNDIETICVENSSFHRGAKTIPGAGDIEVFFRRLSSADGGSEPGRRSFRWICADIHHSAESVVAINAGVRTLYNFHLPDIGHGDARPVHPAAERVVERNVIDKNKRAAHTTRPDAAQGNALRRRMGCEAAGAAEET